MEDSIIKTRILVPEEYKSVAENWGAKFDGRMKSYYVPEDKLITIFNPFIPLTVELVPSSNWEKNVRSEMKGQWDSIRKAVYRNANYKCEICGGVGSKHPVEAHEIWSFDDNTHIQKLEGLIALCSTCHRVKHWGYALISGMESIVRKQIKQINNWKDEDVDKYISEAFKLHAYRSQHTWVLDLSLLQSFNHKNH